MRETWSRDVSWDQVPPLRAERDFEGGARARRRAQRERRADRADARADVPQSLPVAARVAVEALAVVDDRHEATAIALRYANLGARRARVPADVREPLLHDAEQLDLLVRLEVHARVDVELDVEHP